MDLDCTFYFWKRKVGSAMVGLAVTGAVFGIVYHFTKNDVLMSLAYGALVGIFAGTTTNVLLSESYCSDNKMFDCSSSGATIHSSF